MISVFSVNKKPLPLAFSTATITIFVCLDSPTLKLVLNRFFHIVKQIYIISHGVVFNSVLFVVSKRWRYV